MDNVEFQLQIGGNWHKLDVDRSTSFGINYRQSSLTNPTSIKLPFSSELSVPKTKHNNDVFAHLNMQSTVDIINPLNKIPFRLYVNGSLFQAGYIKIEDVDIQPGGFYRIRLYGQPGDFLNAIGGIKLNSLPIDCTHPLNHTEVSKLMAADNGEYGYALTYQGDYDNFDSNLTDNSGGTNTNLIEEATWSGLVKYATTELNEHKRREQDYAGEYRSYYQKPTIKFSFMLDAILAKAEEQGYKVDLDEKFFNEENPYYGKLWLLCNNYNIGDAGNSYGFISEFGDTTKSSSSDDVHITKNEAEQIVNGAKEEIRHDKFISQKASDTTTLRVIVSDYIPVEEGAYIKAKFNVHPIATSYETANYTHYLFKNSEINTSIRIVDASGNILTSNTPTYTPAIPENPVSARRFVDLSRRNGNLEIKRPSDKDGFGRGKNFGYDYTTSGRQDDGGEQDRGTAWQYEIELDGVPAGVDGVYIEYLISGNTWWRTNSNNQDRKYGIAFKVLPGSVIEVNNPDSDEDELTIETGKRTGSKAVYSDLVGNQHSCSDLLLSYTKLFGLIFKQDTIKNSVWIGLRENYYAKDGAYEVLDWTDKIDRSREFKVEPLAFNFRNGVFKYNALDTKYEELYRSKNKSKTVPDYGAFNVDNGYQLSNEEFNYLDGTIFDNCIIASDYSSYYTGRGDGYKDNKELPFLQDAKGSKVDINGFIPLFRDGKEKLNIPIRVTDDTSVMANNGVVCWNNNSNLMYYSQFQEIPRYVKTIEQDGEVYSLNFSTPNTNYSASENLQNARSGLYPKFWQSYITDRLDANCKLLTCYVFLSPTDLQGDLLSKFIYIDGAVWVINEIKSFNPLSPAPTMVTLVKVKDIKNYIDRNNVSDTFKITHGSDVVFDNATGQLPEVIIINESETNVQLTIESSVEWKASSGTTITPDQGQAGETVTMAVSVPVNIQTASIAFNYGSGNATVQIIRQTLVNVTATTQNGTSATINGNPSPQQLAIGTTARFNATGTGQFLYWEINGVRNTSNPTSIKITEATNAVAYFLASNQIRLYSDDPYTTITGVQKEGNYWVLNVGQSYTFNNTQGDFSGFLFSGDTQYTGLGAKTITADNTYLSVFYNQVLLNLTVINNSPAHELDGSYISIGESTFSFNVDPGETIQTTMNGEAGDITFTRMPYHYPTFSQTSFPNPGVFNLTITGNRVGWDGDAVEAITSLNVTKTVYGPVAWRLEAVNCTISPNTGSQDVNISINITGGDAQVIQSIGDFTYTLRLNNDLNTTPVGWNGNGTITVTGNVAQTATSYSAIFWNNRLPVLISSGLTQGAVTNNSDGTSFSTMTATFGENTDPAPRTLTYTVQCNGSEFTMIITQAGTGDYGGDVSQYPKLVFVYDGRIDLEGNITNDEIHYNDGFVSGYLAISAVVINYGWSIEFRHNLPAYKYTTSLTPTLGNQGFIFIPAANFLDNRLYVYGLNPRGSEGGSDLSRMSVRVNVWQLYE